MTYYLMLIAVMSVISYALYAYDKNCARHHKQRVPERTLLWSSLLGGAAGSLLAMHFCHHKTRKWTFRILVPFYLILHLGIGIYLFLKLYT